MNSNDEIIDFKLRTIENNFKLFFEVYKQLEYKAYVIVTFSAILLTAFINLIIKADYSEGFTKIIVIISSFMVFIVFALIISQLIGILYIFNVKDFLYYDFLHSNINGSLKENLFNEMLNKHKGLIEIYNKKEKYIERIIFLSGLEFGVVATFSLLLILFGKIN